MKHASTWVWLMMITYCVEANLLDRQREEDINYDSYGNAGKASAAVMRGRKATIQLITGARQLKAAEKYIIYEKRGNLEAALKDYGSVKPSPIREYNDDFGGFIWITKVGDRNIMLLEHGMKNMPEIKIIADKMTYSVVYRPKKTRGS